MIDPFEEARELVPAWVMRALVDRLRDEHTGDGSLRWRRARGEWVEVRLEPAPLIRPPGQGLTRHGP